MSDIELEVADTFFKRLRGVIGNEMTGAILLRPVYLGIHTFGLSFNLDVAFLDTQLRVHKIKSSLVPNRFAGWLKCRAVLEAPAGSFEKWGIEVGTELEIKDVNWQTRFGRKMLKIKKSTKKSKKE